MQTLAFHDLRAEEVLGVLGELEENVGHEHVVGDDFGEHREQVRDQRAEVFVGHGLDGLDPLAAVLDEQEGFDEGLEESAGPHFEAAELQRGDVDEEGVAHVVEVLDLLEDQAVLVLHEPGLPKSLC